MSKVASINPATGGQLSALDATPEEQFSEIFEKARTAQEKWRGLSFNQRRNHIQKIKRYLADHAEEAADIVSKCNGKTKVDALATEVIPCTLACDWYGKNAEKILKAQRIPNGSILFVNKTTFIEYQPVGVVGIISPWNYPLTIPFGEVIMGLMAGNAIILKVATPTVLVGEFIEKCIKAGDLPDGLFAHIIGGGSAVSQAMFDNHVDKIFFTGSVGVGKQLMKQAADSLTPVSLELGGKDPMIVCADADIERATNCAAWAGYQNAGQSCGGVERVYVHESIFDKFVDLLAAKTKALRHGSDDGKNQVDIGSMTTKSQYNIVKNHVDNAVKEGAIIVAQSQPIGDVSNGFFYPATLLTNVNHMMDVMKEETFGPVVPVMSFKTIEEAIALANDSCLALTSSVFTSSNATGTAIARQIQAGVTTINDHLYTHGLSETPWGGWKESGLGRTHSALGLKEMCNAKTINYELIPTAFIPRNIWFVFYYLFFEIDLIF